MDAPLTDEQRAGDRAQRREGWRLLAAIMRPYWALGLGAISAALIWTVTKLAVPLLVAAAVNQGIIPGDGDEILKYSLLILGVGIFQGVGMGLRRYTAFKLAWRAETDLRDRLFAHLQRLHFAFHDEAQTGQLMARANTDVYQVNQMLVLVPISLSSLFILIGVIVVMVSSNVVLAVLALGTLPLLNVLATRFSRHMGPIGFAQQRKLGDLSGVVEETVAGIRAVKGFGAEDVQAARLEAEADGVLDWALAAARLRGGFLPVLDLLPAFSLVMILWYGGHQVLDGNLNVGDIVAFNLYIVMLIFPLRLAGTLVAQASRATASAGRIAEVLQTDSAVTSPQHPAELAPGGGELRFEHVSFRYGDGPPVLDDLDLVVRPGEAVAIVGPTASGKTTIARLIPRFYDAIAGRVLLDGVDVRDVRLRDLRKAVGIVFEDTFLFSDTIRENIAFADPDATIEQVKRAARLAGAAEFVEALPDSYETVIGEYGYSLSGGQRQRIAIARAVLADPRVLILDDATSSVDPTKEHEIRSALREVMTGRTTVIIAHRPATIALADRVVLLDGGGVAEQGTHEELLARSALYRAVLAQSDPQVADPQSVDQVTDGPSSAHGAVR
ncbi:MAG: ABC transporter ATP-binding protein [Acidimicrobiia bacterium]